MAVKAYAEAHGENFSAYHGDSAISLAGLPDASVDFSVYSIPFLNLFTYSPDIADLGNCSDEAEFFAQYDFILREKLRATKPGRLTAVHCSDLPSRKWSDGYIGTKRFSDQVGDAHEKAGWRFARRVTIWRDPVVEQARTKALNLLYKQLCKDSTSSWPGMSDYIMIFRKPGENQVPVEQKPDDFPLAQWQQWASPCWMDINQTDTINNRASASRWIGDPVSLDDARAEEDERHVCLARGSLVLTSVGYKPIQNVNVGDLVLTHKGRWRKVLVAQNTGVRPVVQLHAHGIGSLVLTPEHEVWTRRADVASYRQRPVAETAIPGWLAANQTKGSYINLKLPPTDDSDSHDETFWWVVGRWLADGHIDKRNVAHVSVGPNKLEYFFQKAGRFADGSNPRNPGSCYQVSLKDPGSSLRDILYTCGHGAGNKEIPPAAYGLNAALSKALLDGYLSGDGYFLQSRQRWMATSISRKLLLGMAMLVQRVYGAIASIFAGRGDRVCIIEGREVLAKQEWNMSFDLNFEERRKKPFILDDGSWRKVREIEPIGEIETWCLRVEEDESFTAEGCIVKNCPLQLGLIERCVMMWSNPGEIVLSPFMGVGSEGVVSLRRNRRFLGVELKKEYHAMAVSNLMRAEANVGDLFDVLSA